MSPTSRRGVVETTVLPVAGRRDPAHGILRSRTSSQTREAGHTFLTRGRGAWSPRQAHNLQAVGSNPTRATIPPRESSLAPVVPPASHRVEPAKPGEGTPCNRALPGDSWEPVPDSLSLGILKAWQRGREVRG